MIAGSRLSLSLAAFLAIAGAVYGVTSHEPSGTTSLLVAAATFCFLGIVMRIAAPREAVAEAHEETEVGVAPTIWPFGIAISGVILALGLIVSPWILLLGGLAFAISAVGWIRDVAHSHARAGGS
jgi:Cytochrome c oxidase subunit IV